MSTTTLRRLRKNDFLRNWVSQTQLKSKDIIMPFFVVEGKNKKEPIAKMAGVNHFSVDRLIKEISKIKNLNSILLFGLSSKKDNKATFAYRKDAPLQKAIRAVKKEFKDLIVISDVCLCAYTSHGHCGIIKETKGKKHKEIDNDATLKVLAKVALSHAEAGSDLVAPSAMMDGQVKAIRTYLDSYGFNNTGIMAYSAKFASNFYGPFRSALKSTPSFGDRKTYQMDFRNPQEALREIKKDIAEGADIVMVKPALAYLDIIYQAKKNFKVPLAAYSVSGEYSMIKAYSRQSGSKAIEVEKDLVLETITSIKRSGADFIITYWAKEILKWIK